MKMRWRHALTLVAATASTAAARAAPPEAEAFFREGQTFLTWREDASATGEWYCVYAAAEPITAQNVAQAKCVARIPEGSRRFQFLRNVDIASQPFFNKLAQEKWMQAIQIEDDENGARQLPEGTGLFIRTIHAPAKTWYAVTVERDGTEDRVALMATEAAVEEVVQPPGAVLQRKLADRYYLYAMFCDYEVWNPDGVEDNWEGYTHVFHVRVPDAGARNTGEPYPVAVKLHAYSAWDGWNLDSAWPDMHVNLAMIDYHLTWWFGYHDCLPTLDPVTKLPPPGKVVNFTERRVLQATRWLASNPRNLPCRVDPERIVLFGGSMGGTGTHTIGSRNGDVFAAAFADEGIWNWALGERWNIWQGNVRRPYGPLERNDPTLDGVPVYDALNRTKQAAEHPERELPFFDIGQGLADYVIPFHGVDEFWTALEKGKHPYAAGWGLFGHLPWAGPASAMDYRLMRRDEVVPALANASCNGALRSSFRIMGIHEGLTPKTLRIEAGSLNKDVNVREQNDHVEGSFPPDMKGKTLVLGLNAACPKTIFRIASNTATELTIGEGDLIAFQPELTAWEVGLVKEEIRKKEGQVREPKAEERLSMSEALKKRFIICDGDPCGTWNGHFQWSTKHQNFDASSTQDDIVDEAGRMAMCLRVTTNRFSRWDGESATADVTPRRCRNFRPAPGEKVRWENWDMTAPAQPVRRAEGWVEADAHGLVTVPEFVVGRKGWGSRLVLSRKSDP
jgi:hypothetical protein